MLACGGGDDQQYDQFFASDSIVPHSAETMKQGRYWCAYGSKNVDMCFK